MPRKEAIIVPLLNTLRQSHFDTCFCHHKNPRVGEWKEMNDMWLVERVYYFFNDSKYYVVIDLLCFCLTGSRERCLRSHPSQKRSYRWRNLCWFVRGEDKVVFWRTFCKIAKTAQSVSTLTAKVYFPIRKVNACIYQNYISILLSVFNGQFPHSISYWNA